MVVSMIRRYIFNIVDILDDGHYDFWAVNSLFRLGEDAWHNIHYDFMSELTFYLEYYTQFYGSGEWVNNLLFGLFH